MIYPARSILGMSYAVYDWLSTYSVFVSLQPKNINTVNVLNTLKYLSDLNPASNKRTVPSYWSSTYPLFSRLHIYENHATLLALSQSHYGTSTVLMRQHPDLGRDEFRISLHKVVDSEVICRGLGKVYNRYHNAFVLILMPVARSIIEVFRNFGQLI